MLTRKRKLSADTRGKKLLCRKRKYRKNHSTNLKKYNQESNQITRESLEISLMQLLEKKELKKNYDFRAG